MKIRKAAKRLRFKVWLIWNHGHARLHAWDQQRWDRKAMAVGWWRDRDGWLLRAVRKGDPRPDQLANSSHAFIERGAIYCRNGRQALALDEGKLV